VDRSTEGEELGTPVGTLDGTFEALGDTLLEGISEGEEIAAWEGLRELEGVPDDKTLGAALGKTDGIRDDDGNALGDALGAPDGGLDGRSHAEVQGEPSRKPPVSDQTNSLSNSQPVPFVHFASSSVLVQRRPPESAHMLCASQ